MILDEFLKNDFEISMLRNYTLHQPILDLAPDKPFLHGLLVKVKHLTIALTKQIIREMAKFKIVNEVSLYLEQPISLNQIHNWRQKQLYNAKVKTFKDNIQLAAKNAFEKFTTLLKELKEKHRNDYDLNTYLAVALYFVTYYHPKNTDCQKYLKLFNQDAKLKAFAESSDKYFG